MHRPAWVEIDLRVLDKNIKTVKARIAEGSQLLAVVNRLYPYWIDGIRYPKLKGAGVIGVCADLGQSWDIFDRTWRSIFHEVGWPEKGIVHAPRFMDHASSYLRMAREFGRGF